MSNFNWGKSILLTLTLGLLGFFVAWWLLGKYAKGEFAWWSSMGRLPEKALKISGLNPHANGSREADVYIETATGKIYSSACCTQTGATWIETHLPHGLFYSPCSESYDNSQYPYFANLPARVIDCQQIPWSWEWITDKSFFVILEDNTVWWWREYRGFDTLAIFLFGGPLIGVIIGIGLSAIIGRRRKQSTV